MSPSLVRSVAESMVPSSIIFPTSSVRCATDASTPVTDAPIFVGKGNL